MHYYHFLTLFSLCNFLPSGYSHGRLLDPPMRASIWRFPEFNYANPPVNYDDDAFWCGSMQTLYNQNGGKCGVCGDNWADPPPRSQEDGGKFGKSIIVRNYTSGQTIPLTVELTGAHDGYFEFRLCARNSRSEPETEECYNKNLLVLSNGSTRLPATRRKGIYKTTARLPPGVTCSRCSIQWHYRTGNNWGDCNDGTSAVGCGNQEIFRGCSDVAIT
ncbi:unnamed protein product [Orchesella dallaii]|uniref:Chitin-binding type-4 domain-containing protein n=1 Tax=Orchesella dallaii TaxID=48710 RepID=A0ABP1RD29_9HEXA